MNEEKTPMKALIVPIAEITEAQKDGSWIKAILEWETENPETITEEKSWEWEWVKWNTEKQDFFDRWGDRVRSFTHYLPNGLPTPDQAVEVFESGIGELYTIYDDCVDAIEYPEGMEYPVGAKVGVYKLPEATNG